MAVGNVEVGVRGEISAFQADFEQYGADKTASFDFEPFVKA